MPLPVPCVVRSQQRAMHARGRAQQARCARRALNSVSDTRPTKHTPPHPPVPLVGRRQYSRTLLESHRRRRQSPEPFLHKSKQNAARAPLAPAPASSTRVVFPARSPPLPTATRRITTVRQAQQSGTQEHLATFIVFALEVRELPPTRKCRRSSSSPRRSPPLPRTRCRPSCRSRPKLLPRCSPSRRLGPGPPPPSQGERRRRRGGRRPGAWRRRRRPHLRHQPRPRPRRKCPGP